MKYSHNADQISIFNFGKVLKVNLDKNHELVKIENLLPWDELVMELQMKNLLNV